jgi:hypothetical protein
MDGSFTRQDYPTAQGNFAGIGLGDLNEDGRTDAVVSDYGGGVFILPQTAGGGLGVPIGLSTAPNAATSLEVADVDGDGLEDIVGSVSGILAVMYQASNRSFSWLCLYTGGDGYWDLHKGLAVGDMNSDGKMDVVVADWLSPYLNVLRQVSQTGSTVILRAAPPSIDGGEPVTLSGSVQLVGGGCSDGLALHLVRANPDGSNTTLPDVVADAGGAFTTTDVPAQTGDNWYTASFDGDETHTGSSGQSVVTVRSLTSTMTLTGSPDTAPVGAPVGMTGQVRSSNGQPVGVQTVHCSRANPDHSVTGLPDVVSDASGAFSFSDTPPDPGRYVYAAAWDGDAYHSGSGAASPAMATSPDLITDFNGDGFADLAVGVPLEDVGSVADAGAVNVIYGSDSGLTSAGDQFWSQNSSGIEGKAEKGDQFGVSVASGDFDGDGFSDMAVGANAEDVDNVANAGAVSVLYGSAAGLTSSADQLWDQDVTDVNDKIEAGDSFGVSLATGDLNHDGYADLMVGVPGEDVSGNVDAGAVNVLYGSATGLTSAGDQFWTQNSSGILDQAEACDPSNQVCDQFGFSLAGGDTNGDGYDDMVAGVFGEDLAKTDAGAVGVIFGSAAGLSSAGNQLWSQDSADVEDAENKFDDFGSSVATGDINGTGTPTSRSESRGRTSATSMRGR